MGVIQIIKNEKDLMDNLEKMAGLKGIIEVSGKQIAQRIGLKYWSKPLQSKLNLLEKTGRIRIDRGSRKRSIIRILKPLTSKEKKELSNSVIFGEMANIEQAIKNNTSNNIEKAVTTQSTPGKQNTPMFSDQIEAAQLTIEEKDILTEKTISNTDDIDEIFDDLTGSVRNILLKFNDYKDRISTLELELEKCKQREHKWMTKAIELQSGLRRG